MVGRLYYVHGGIIALLCILFTTNASIIPWPAKSYQFEQVVDHFSYGPGSGAQRYKQKVLFEDKWFNQERGPIFFYCGNEGPIEAFWNNTGFMFEAAQEFQALVVFGEHRYYGESLPFGASKAFQQPYIQYLAIEQTLADFAYLLEDVRQRFNAPGRSVIAFGGSYGGQLAAYMRFKYPNQVLGALSSSAPLSWVSGQGQFHQFFETITEDCRSYRAECPVAISAAYKSIQDLAMEGVEGLAHLSKAFLLCQPLKNTDDADHLMRWIRNAFVMMAMMDYPYESSFMANLPANPINKSCDALLQYGGGLVGLREAVGVFYNDSTLKCFNPAEQYIQCADITGCGLGPDSLAWDFQACTEIALYDDAMPTERDMFPYLPQRKADVDRYCRNKWNISRADTQLKTLMWGEDVKYASNIIFANGNLDPWSRGGVLRNVSESVVALMVYGGAHHLDLRESHPKDPASVRTVRQSEKTIILKWLDEAAKKETL